MLRILFPFQICSRVPPIITPKLLETCSLISKGHHSPCSTEVPTLDYKKPKYRRVIKGVQSPFKHHYNVPYVELSNLLLNHLPKLKYVSKDQLNDLLIYLKKGDYKWEEVKREKEILLLSYREVKDRFNLLDEFGFLHPRLHDVLHIGVFLQTKVTLLRTLGMYSEHYDVIDHILYRTEELELPEEVLLKIKDTLQDIEELSLSGIHLYILAHYLSQRFKVDVDVVKDMMKIQLLPTWKPLMAYAQICDILIEVLKLKFSFVMDHPAVLNINPENVKKIIRRCSVIGGAPISELIRQDPKILLIPHQKLSRWGMLFNKYKVTELKATPEIIRLFQSDVTKELEERFAVLRKMPEFEVVLVSKRFFELLLKPHAIKKIVDLTYSGQPLTTINAAFYDVKSSRLNSYRLLSREMKTFIANELGIDEHKDPEFAPINELRTNLGIANTRKVLKLLIDYGFSKEQILDCIQILSLEYAPLKSTLDNFARLPETQPFHEWMKNSQVLHLLAYLVKKDTPTNW
ncbi:uncharacterized protein [Macrobrachium rosenbergii]|uniref:uncharacterized protein isoform X2 n=1 Tax=Macrobrachium rosenbergii TaxID=79674 RepID=UPI0034D58188